MKENTQNVIDRSKAKLHKIKSTKNCPKILVLIKYSLKLKYI